VPNTGKVAPDAQPLEPIDLLEPDGKKVTPNTPKSVAIDSLAPKPISGAQPY